LQLDNANILKHDTRYLLFYLSKYLDQETAKWPFRPSSQAVTCYYESNHSKVGAIPPQNANLRLAIHYPFYAERQAGKLW